MAQATIGTVTPAPSPYDLPDVSDLVVGVLGGTGEQGRGLARRLALSGQRVVLGSRSAERAVASAAELGLGITGTDNAGCASEADVVIVAGAPDAETLGLFGRQAAHAVAVIRQNVGISLVTKLAFLVSALLGSAPLWLAVVADTGATVAVTLNGLRLLRLRR